MVVSRFEVDAQVLDAAVAVLAHRLPHGWRCQPQPHVPTPRSELTVALDVTSPEGSGVLVPVASGEGDAREVLRAGPAAFGGDTERRLELAPRGSRVGDPRALVVARSLSPQARAALTAAGLAYVDLSGNVRWWARRPAFFVSDAAPPTLAPPEQDLDGEGAAQVVRALADRPGMWRMAELIRRSGVAPPTAYRVVGHLTRRGYLFKDGGRVDVVDRAGLLVAWAGVYRFRRANRVLACRARLDLPQTLEALAGGAHAVWVTGEVAAAAWVPAAVPRTLAVYAHDPEAVAEQMGWSHAGEGVNVLVAAPAFEVQGHRAAPSATWSGLRVAAPAQAAADLLGGAGAAGVAGMLLEWLGRLEG